MVLLWQEDVDLTKSGSVSINWVKLEHINLMGLKIICFQAVPREVLGGAEPGGESKEWVVTSA